MKSVGVIGLGRFGKVLVNILQKGYLINAYDINDKAPISNVNFCSLDKVLDEHIIFIAVPIRRFDSLITDISRKIKPGRETCTKHCLTNIFNLRNIKPSFIRKSTKLFTTPPNNAVWIFSNYTKNRFLPFT